MNEGIVAQVPYLRQLPFVTYAANPQLVWVAAEQATSYPDNIMTLYLFVF
jgi:hypothetical protein